MFYCGTDTFWSVLQALLQLNLTTQWGRYSLFLYFIGGETKAIKHWFFTMQTLVSCFQIYSSSNFAPIVLLINNWGKIGKATTFSHRLGKNDSLASPKWLQPKYFPFLAFQHFVLPFYDHSTPGFGISISLYSPGHSTGSTYWKKYVQFKKVRGKNEERTLVVLRSCLLGLSLVNVAMKFPIANMTRRIR